MLKHYFPITIPQKYSFHWFLFLLAKFFLMNQDSVLFICHPFGSHYASIFLTRNSLLLITLSLISLSQSRYWQSVCMLSNQSMKSFPNTVTHMNKAVFVLLGRGSNNTVYTVGWFLGWSTCYYREMPAQLTSPPPVPTGWIAPSEPDLNRQAGYMSSPPRYWC